MFTFEFIKTFVKQHLNSVPDFGLQKLISQRRAGNIKKSHKAKLYLTALDKNPTVQGE